jgi:hypothetical protein
MFKVLAALFVQEVVGQYDNTTIDWDSVGAAQTVNVTIDGAKESAYQRFDVTFTWNESGNHSLFLMASQAAFDDCNFTDAVEMTNADMPLMFFPQNQTLYYACADDCGDGHKVAVQVLCDGDNDTAVEQETAMDGNYSSIKTCADVVSNSSCDVGLLMGGSLPSAKYCVCACRAVTPMMMYASGVEANSTNETTTTTTAATNMTTSTTTADANVTTTTAGNVTTTAATNMTTTTMGTNATTTTMMGTNATTTTMMGTSNVTTTTAKDNSEAAANGAFPSCPSPTHSLLAVLVTMVLK